MTVDPARANVVLDWDGSLAVSFPRADLPGVLASGLDAFPLSFDTEGVAEEMAVALRPHTLATLNSLASQYNLFIWTYGMPAYIRDCLAVSSLGTLFPADKVFSRADMYRWRTGFKDLFLLCDQAGIPLTRTVMVDDAHFHFGRLNPVNCVDIPTWDLDKVGDTKLLLLPAQIEAQLAILSRYTEEELLQIRMEYLSRR